MADENEKTKVIASMEGFPPGTHLNDTYVIDAKLALGGMAEVYRGRNIHTDEPVAIKIVLPEYSREATILALFRKEATVLSRLSHDAIVRYLSFTVEPVLKRPYLVMEFVDGVSLLDRLQVHRLDVEETYTVIWRIASGLAVSHAAGVIHRDLSPDNVILPENDPNRTKIIDFGIAKSATGGGTLLGGKFAGKYNFVSPEQLGLYGGEVTERSDVYSLGLIAAAANSGAVLEMSGSHADIIEKRRHIPDLNSIDETLRPLIGHMLEPDPEKRTASMSDVLQELVALGAKTPTHPGSWPHPAFNNKSVPPLGPDRPSAEQPGGTSGSESPFGPVVQQASPTGWQPPGTGEKKRRADILPALGVLAVLIVGGAAVYSSGFIDPYLPGGSGSSSPADVGPSVGTRLDARATDLEVRRRVAEIPAQTCLFTRALGPSGNLVNVIALSADQTALGALQATLQPDNGVPVSVAEQRVETAQCPVVDMLSETAAPPAGTLLTLSTNNLPSNSTLRGTMAGPEGWLGALFIVDNTGLVYDVSTFLQQQNDEMVFSMSLQAQTAEPAPQLLLAVYSPQRLDLGAAQYPVDAATFSTMLTSATNDGQAVAIQPGYFTVAP